MSLRRMLCLSSALCLAAPAAARAQQGIFAPDVAQLRQLAPQTPSDWGNDATTVGQLKEQVARMEGDASREATARVVISRLRALMDADFNELTAQLSDAPSVAALPAYRGEQLLVAEMRAAVAGNRQWLDERREALSGRKKFTAHDLLATFERLARKHMLAQLYKQAEAMAADPAQAAMAHNEYLLNNIGHPLPEGARAPLTPFQMKEVVAKAAAALEADPAGMARWKAEDLAAELPPTMPDHLESDILPDTAAKALGWLDNDTKELARFVEGYAAAIGMAPEVLPPAAAPRSKALPCYLSPAECAR